MNQNLKTILKSIDNRSSKFAQKDQILLFLSFLKDNASNIGNLKQLAAENNYKEIENWNISNILSLLKKKGLIVKIADGWIITKKGERYTNDQILKKADNRDNNLINNDLRTYIKSIKNKETKKYLEETLTCINNNCYRASILMSWIGAVSVLYDHVITNKLTEFNIEANKKSNKISYKTREDLACLKESDFLEILHKIKVIDKNLKKRLINQCLELRNTCGHPNDYKVSKKQAEAHLEILLLNIFNKY